MFSFIDIVCMSTSGKINHTLINMNGEFIKKGCMLRWPFYSNTQYIPYTTILTASMVKP